MALGPPLMEPLSIFQLGKHRVRMEPTCSSDNRRCQDQESGDRKLCRRELVIVLKELAGIGWNGTIDPVMVAATATLL